MSSSNLTQIYAARALTGALSAATDLFYVADVSETTDVNIDKGMTRHELLRAMAESARLGGSKYTVPFLPQITGLTGGGATKLDGLLEGLIVTDVQIPFAVDLSFSDDYQRWKLRVKAVGEVADGVTLIAPVNTAFSSYIFCRMPIPNAALGNSTITLGSSTLTLGSTTTTVAAANRAATAASNSPATAPRTASTALGPRRKAAPELLAIRIIDILCMGQGQSIRSDLLNILCAPTEASTGIRPDRGAPGRGQREKTVKGRE